MQSECRRLLEPGVAVRFTVTDIGNGVYRVGGVFLSPVLPQSGEDGWEGVCVPLPSKVADGFGVALGVLGLLANGVPSGLVRAKGDFCAEYALW